MIDDKAMLRASRQARDLALQLDLTAAEKVRASEQAGRLLLRLALLCHGDQPEGVRAARPRVAAAALATALANCMEAMSVRGPARPRQRRSPKTVARR